MRPKAWLILVAFVTLMTPLVGCKSVFYHGRYPVLEKPAWPRLENVPGSEMKKMSPGAQAAVSGNFNKLLDHARKLEAAVDGYNRFAREKNEGLGLESP